MKQLFRIVVREEAATTVEYAVMLALILLGLLGTAALVDKEAGGMWAGVQSGLINSGALK